MWYLVLRFAVVLVMVLGCRRLFGWLGIHHTVVCCSRVASDSGDMVPYWGRLVPWGRRARADVDGDVVSWVVLELGCLG